MTDIDRINTHQMVNIFRSLFPGQSHIYGTYDRDYKNVRVVKDRVTEKVIWSHISKGGKRVIRESEIISQTSYAYNHSYTGYGCKSEAVKPFCDHSCPVMKWLNRNKKIVHDDSEMTHRIIQ